MSRAWRAGLLTLGWPLLLAPAASAAESTGVDKAINDALGPFAEQAATVVFWGRRSARPRVRWS
ncbi:MAG TPA: hypothetical protein VK923_13015 [Euzebyales bacterium]|nr:hypothetical protein [Euzebyales bacterium]